MGNPSTEKEGLSRRSLWRSSRIDEGLTHSLSSPESPWTVGGTRKQYVCFLYSGFLL